VRSAARLSAAAAALACAAAVAGCGLGEGSSEGEAELTVTRDYGAEQVLSVEEEVSGSDTVMRLLDRNAEIETRYGGGFVQSIDGTAGGERDGRRLDWFFYVDGIESSIGAAQAKLAEGDRVWWDYRDWTSAMRVPAVVGSWPQPFAGGASDERSSGVECWGERAPCDWVAGRLRDLGATAVIAETGRGPAASGPRIIVGPWALVRADPTARLIERGPEESGVFARMARAGGGFELVALDELDREVERFGPGTGLVAALRVGDAPPTWVATGTDQAGVDAAVAALDEEDLDDRYAVAVRPGGELVALPR
jgi:hypothetical protein